MTPLADIDACLIYGIPFVAKASSEGDIVQYREMKVLSQQLWKYMVTHQVALVLQMASGQRVMEARHVKDRKPFEAGACLYHSDRQVFLLVVEENNDATSLPSNGILYRYADRTDQILHNGSNDHSESMNADPAQDIYYNYIVQSLEGVQTSSINPFSQHHLSPHAMEAESHQSSDGSSATVPSADHGDVSSPIQFEIVDNDYDDVQGNIDENDHRNLSYPDLFEYCC